MKGIYFLPVAALLLSAGIAPPVRQGPVVVATSPALAPVVRQLAARFAREPGGTTISVIAPGSDVAMAHLTTGKADLAVIGRPAFEQEAKAFEWVYQVPVKAHPLFAGTTARPGLSAPLAFRVNAANPLRAVTQEQLQTAFAQGDPGLTWDRLGVGTGLSGKTIRLVMPDSESGTGRFLRARVLADQVQFPWSRVTEVSVSGPRADQFGARIAAAVARDPQALGVGDPLPVKGTRVLAVVVEGKAYLPGQAGYPYGRTIMAYDAPSPRPEIGAFVRFLGSPAARAELARAGFD